MVIHERYSKEEPIKPEQVTAWIIKLPDGSSILELWDKDATIEDVHSSCAKKFDNFLLGAQGIGGFWIELFDKSHRTDHRVIDGNWGFGLDLKTCLFCKSLDTDTNKCSRKLKVIDNPRGSLCSDWRYVA